MSEDQKQDMNDARIDRDHAWRQYHNLRDEIAGDYEKWFRILGGCGLTGYQPECATMMDQHCRQHVKMRTAAAVMLEHLDRCGAYEAFPDLGPLANALEETLP